MGAARPHRTLIVANRTPGTLQLEAEVRRRAHAEPTEFALIVPRRRDDWTIERAAQLLQRDARGPVVALPTGRSAFAAIRRALAGEPFDDVVISTRNRWLSTLLRSDLPHRVRRLGLPVTVVSAGGSPGSAPTNDLAAIESLYRLYAK